VRDDELPRTIEAIRTLHRVFLNENPPIARIEASHPALIALSRPFDRLRVRLGLTGSVGSGGDNAFADVVKVHLRLRDLSQLSPADFQTEAPLVVDPVDFNRLPQTLQAILEWRTLHEAGAANGLLERFEAALRRFEWPVLPIPTELPLGKTVGVTAASPNLQADVVLVQKRLHELGLLDTIDYLHELRIALGLASVRSAQVPETFVAIMRFQNTAGGGIAHADQIISVNGHTHRILRDPTYGSPAPTNPDTGNRDAGPAMPAGLHRELPAIIAAIEAHEGAGAVGEVPAILRNGSQMPASFGKAQAIGGTALATVAADAGSTAFYDLDADIAALNAVVPLLLAQYARIDGLLPAALTEANLQVAIAADRAANLAAFQSDTGLGPSDHEHMFRTIQFRRQALAFVNAQAGANIAAKRAAAGGNVAAFVAMADVGVNMLALAMKQSDAEAFLRATPSPNLPGIDNEHRQGFLTRALFSVLATAPDHPDPGLALKHAMTDDSGFKLGRFVIRDNFAAVLAGGAGLTREQRAQITARIHNSGPGGLAGFLANPATAVNPYVNAVMAHWVDPGPP